MPCSGSAEVGDSVICSTVPSCETQLCNLRPFPSPRKQALHSLAAIPAPQLPAPAPWQPLTRRPSLHICLFGTFFSGFKNHSRGTGIWPRSWDPTSPAGELGSCPAPAPDSSFLLTQKPGGSVMARCWLQPPTGDLPFPAPSFSLHLDQQLQTLRGELGDC